jgi:hypothetical protein
VINIVTRSGSSLGSSDWADWQSPRGKILKQIMVEPTSKATDYGFYLGTTLTITVAISKVDYLIKNEDRDRGPYVPHLDGYLCVQLDASIS